MTEKPPSAPEAGPEISVSSALVSYRSRFQKPLRTFLFQFHSRGVRAHTPIPAPEAGSLRVQGQPGLHSEILSQKANIEINKNTDNDTYVAEMSQCNLWLLLANLTF